MVDEFNTFGDDYGKYWFVSVVEPESGRLVVLGEYKSREEAYRMALQKLTANFEVFDMPTKDRAKATQHAKYVMFNKTEDLKRSIQRAKHKV